MTLSSLINQPDDALNVMLAEAVGFTDITFCPLMGFHQQRSDEKSKECGGRWRFAIPNYCSDLNAVASIDSKLLPDNRHRYQQFLSQVCEQERRMAEIGWLMIVATARQRTIALILTLKP